MSVSSINGVNGYTAVKTAETEKASKAAETTEKQVRDDGAVYEKSNETKKSFYRHIEVLCCHFDY